MKFPRYLSLLVILFLLLACKLPHAKNEAKGEVVSVTHQYEQTNTPTKFFISATSFLQHTSSNSVLPSPIVATISRKTATQTEPVNQVNQLPGFEGAGLYSYWHMGFNRFAFTIQFVTELEDDFYAILGEDRFECNWLRDFPGRLYCEGDGLLPGEDVDVQIFSTAGDEFVYEESFTVPPYPLASQTPTKKATTGSIPTPTSYITFFPTFTPILTPILTNTPTP